MDPDSQTSNNDSLNFSLNSNQELNSEIDFQPDHLSYSNES